MGDTAQIVWFTVRVAAAATILLVPPGTLLAWLLARREFRGKALVETLVALPLVLPPVATGLILLKLFSRRAPLGGFLHDLGLDVVFTWRGVVLAMMVMALPLYVRTARVAFEQVNHRLEDIARTLGARELRVFATITLPLALRGVVGGAILAFARALGEFGATVMVAGAIPGQTATLSVSIYNFVQLAHDSAALELVVISAVIAFVAVWASELVLRRRPA
jgi:molybdate transport system permease protein